MYAEPENQYEPTDSGFISLLGSNLTRLKRFYILGPVYAEPENQYEPTDSGFTEDWSDLTSDR